MACIDSLRSRVDADPWDTDAAQALVSEAASGLPYEEAAPILAAASQRFPSSSRVWRLAADAAARVVPLDVGKVKGIYEEAVSAAPTSIDLWRDYARWAEASPDAGIDVAGVFERGIKVAGVDLMSNGLWSDYLSWLKRADMGEMPRRDALRKVYQRAVRNPMHEVDGVWAQYRHFEETTNSNKDLGRGLLAEAQPKYVAARSECRTRRIRREGLALHAWAVPPRGRPKEASQASQWRKFIAAEKSNPHTLELDMLHERVVHAYETALAPLYRYPDIWIDYLSYLVQVVDGQNQGSGAAGKLGPGLKVPSTDSKDMSEFEAASGRAMRALPECVALFNHVSCMWLRSGNPQKALSTLDALVKSKPSPLAFVHLMRLTRKVSGKEATRKVFAKARRDTEGAHPAVYIAAAQIEFIINKDNKVARNVFEFGLKHYPKSALMVREFVEWLWGLGDFDHLRVVLKRIMPSIEGPVPLVCALWERWIELEEAVGDVASVEAVEKSWLEGGGVGLSPSPVGVALRRSRFLGLEGMREEELAIIGGPVSASNGSIGGSSTVGASGATGTVSKAGSATGGRRDPRTGRIVPSGSANRDPRGVARKTGGGGPSGGGPAGDRMASGLLPGNSFEEIESNIRRMAAGMQSIPAPPPEYEAVVQLVMNTPYTFSETPAGAGNPGANNAISMNGKGAGRGPRKRSGEEMMGASVPQLQQQQQPPQQDLFRARQAAKQQRTM